MFSVQFLLVWKVEDTNNCSYASSLKKEKIDSGLNTSDWPLGVAKGVGSNPLRIISGTEK